LRKFYISFFFVVAILSVNCSAPVEIKYNDKVNKNMTEKTFVGLGFKVNIDKSLKVTSKSPVEDFVLYTFSKRDDNILHAYSGNHPEFPTVVEKASKKINVLIGNLNTECFEWKSSEDKYSRECLIDLSNEMPFPQYVHFWYYDLTFDEKELVDNIIASVSLNK